MNRLIKLIVSIACFFMCNAYGLLNLELTQGTNAQIPITLLPFKEDSPLTTHPDVVSIVSADLSGTHQFILRSIDNAKNATHIDFWQKQNINGLVSGEIINQKNNQAIIKVSITDVYSPLNNTIHKDITVENNNWRKAAHEISNMIYEHFIGKPGFFTTRIVFVNTTFLQKKPTQWQLQTKDYDGFNSKTLITSSLPIALPKRSPINNEVAYITYIKQNNYPAQPQLNIINTKTLTIKTIIPARSYIASPAWSDDGKSIAVSTMQNGMIQTVKYSVTLGDPSTALRYTKLAQDDSIKKIHKD